MATNLLIVAKDCTPATAPATGIVIEWCASGSDGNKGFGTTAIDFQKSALQMNVDLLVDIKAQYAASFPGATFDVTSIIRQAGQIA